LTLAINIPQLTPCTAGCLIINFAFTAKRLLDFVFRCRYPLRPQPPDSPIHQSESKEAASRKQSSPVVELISSIA